MQTKSVELTRNDMKMIKRALTMYRTRKKTMSNKEDSYCRALFNYIEEHYKELMK